MPKNRGPRKPPAPKKPPLTHFLCLPLVTRTSKPQLEKALKEFTNIVTDEGSNQASIDGNTEAPTSLATTNVHPKAIRPVGTLHLTLGVMSLDRAQLDEATTCLQELDITSILREAGSAENKDQMSSLATPLKVDLKGLVSMHSPEATSILYSAPTDHTGRLYDLCVSLHSTFKERGLLVEDDRPLKLHATIVNTVYAKGRKRPPPKTSPSLRPGSTAGEDQDDRSERHGPKAHGSLKMNATALLDQFKDFSWAEDVCLDRVAICEMGAKKKFNSDGRTIGEEYTEVVTVALPTSQAD